MANDPIFGLTGYGCNVSTRQQLHVGDAHRRRVQAAQHDLAEDVVQPEPGPLHRRPRSARRTTTSGFTLQNQTGDAHTTTLTVVGPGGRDVPGVRRRHQRGLGDRDQRQADRHLALRRDGRHQRGPDRDRVRQLGRRRRRHRRHDGDGGTTGHRWHDDGRRAERRGPAASPAPAAASPGPAAPPPGPAGAPPAPAAPPPRGPAAATGAGGASASGGATGTGTGGANGTGGTSGTGTGGNATGEGGTGAAGEDGFERLRLRHRGRCQGRFLGDALRPRAGARRDAGPRPPGSCRS